MKKRYIIVTLLVIAGLFTGVTLRLMINNTQSFNIQNNLHNGGLIHGILHIVVTDNNGNIKYNITQPMDSPTLWFARIFALIMSNPGDVTTTVNDTTGTNITVGIRCDSYAYEYTFSSIGADAQDRVFIVFGNGSNPSFSITKYKLDSEVFRTYARTMSIILSDGKVHLYISGSTSSTLKANITEVGIIYKIDKYDATNNDYADILIVYDVLSTPVSLNPGDIISISYDIVFG